MKRKWDMAVGAVGGIVSLIFLGGIAVTVRQLTPDEFKKIYADSSLSAQLDGVSLEHAQEMLNRLAGYFALALFGALAFLTAALLLSSKDRYLRVTASLYAIAGLILLLGTQFVAYPFAFLFFAACGLVIYRYSLRRKEQICIKL